MNKNALIVGITGQDGAYLSRHLLKLGYKVFGGTRDSLMCDKSRLILLGIEKDIELISIAPNDFGSVAKALDFCKPDEIYYLAGVTSVSLSFDQPLECMESIATGTINFLEAIKLINKKIKFFNAGSAECFGNIENIVANEQTSFSPRSPYAIAKATAYWQVANYRECFNLFCCTAILGNHESPLRPKRFVTQKIISELKKIKSHKSKKLILGNLHTTRDWGWASEYVEAIHLMVQNKIPKDYIIATGKSHSLNDFVEFAFEYAKLNKSEYLVLDNSLLRPNDINFSNLDPSKINEELGWYAKTKFQDIIINMYEGVF
ncbi:GDP-mannose 4,6-dehydratase [Prochlorococcus sp. AH-736-K09]|nr:GDP-mannose 4,6-dehydratase [Prochlorococcus sp. AH-736-K09]